MIKSIEQTPIVYCVFSRFQTFYPCGSKTSYCYSKMSRDQDPEEKARLDTEEEKLIDPSIYATVVRFEESFETKAEALTYCNARYEQDEPSRKSRKRTRV